MAHMEFIYEFNCIADEILANSCPAEPVEDADVDLLHQTEMEWQGTTGGMGFNPCINLVPPRFRSMKR